MNAEVRRIKKRRTHGPFTASVSSALLSPGAPGSPCRVSPSRLIPSPLCSLRDLLFSSAVFPCRVGGSPGCRLDPWPWFRRILGVVASWRETDFLSGPGMAGWKPAPRSSHPCHPRDPWLKLPVIQSVRVFALLFRAASVFSVVAMIFCGRDSVAKIALSDSHPALTGSPLLGRFFCGNLRPSADQS